MGAKLNFKTYLQNRFFNFFCHISEGPESYDCTKTSNLYTFIPLRLYVSVTSHFHYLLEVKTEAKLQQNVYCS